MGLAFNHNSTIREFDWETVNQNIESFCLQNSVPAAKVFSLELVIEELVTNVIKYGKCPDGNEIIKIEATIHD
jgi:anti-sigma regulatory factor (Ser/Thr protein kinase)